MLLWEVLVEGSPAAMNPSTIHQFSFHSIGRYFGRISIIAIVLSNSSDYFRSCILSGVQFLPFLLYESVAFVYKSVIYYVLYFFRQLLKQNILRHLGRRVDL